MNNNTDRNMFAKYLDDWGFLSVQLGVGSKPEIDTWASRWRNDSDLDLEFLFHNGVLKAFSWFVVDCAIPGIPAAWKAGTKTAVFDVLNHAIVLDEDGLISRDDCLPIDWRMLRKQIHDSISMFR